MLGERLHRLRVYTCEESVRGTIINAPARDQSVTVPPLDPIDVRFLQQQQNYNFQLCRALKVNSWTLREHV